MAMVYDPYAPVSPAHELLADSAAAPAEKADMEGERWLAARVAGRSLVWPRRRAWRAAGISFGLLVAAALAIAALSLTMARTTARMHGNDGAVGLVASRCKTAKQGDQCYMNIKWAIKQDEAKHHPDWPVFAGIGDDSSFEAYQANFHKERPKTCPYQPCRHGNEAPAKPKPKPKPVEKAANAGAAPTAGAAAKEGAAEDAGPCQTAVKGDKCYEGVMWAMKKGIAKHPDWFKDLPAKPSLEQVQLHFHKDPNSDGSCKKPCPPCHTAVKGDKCYTTIQWARTQGIAKHPDWFVGLTSESATEDIQQHFFEDPESDGRCKRPCPPGSAPAAPAKEACHTAEDGEDCYSAVMWVMDKGIGAHPDWFKGLGPKSSVEDVQMALHNNPHAKTKCPPPCI